MKTKNRVLFWQKLAVAIGASVIFVDLILRINLIKIGVNPGIETLYYEGKSLLPMIIIESFLLLSAFLFHLFILKKEGFFKRTSEGYKKTPKKKIFLFSFVIACVISFFSITLRVILQSIFLPNYEVPAQWMIMFIAFLYLTIAVITFSFSYLFYYAAYRADRKAQTINSEF